MGRGGVRGGGGAIIKHETPLLRFSIAFSPISGSVPFNAHSADPLIISMASPLYS
jgi:hypothetical protein